MRGTLQEEIAKMNFALPVMPLLTWRLQQDNIVKGQVIGWHCHLTEITAVAADALLHAGAKLFLSECNSETTNADSVEYMRAKGAQVFLGSNSPNEVLAARPRIISDTGLVLTRAYATTLKHEAPFVFAASEITTSGITAVAELGNINLPIIDINNGQIKTYVENYHGVADGVIDLLAQLTGKVWSGIDVCVIGYGIVGRGIAAYLRRIGANVLVVERDPVRNLIAHYDGFRLSNMGHALAASSLVVTATGTHQLIGPKEWSKARDQALFINVGHWSSELDIEALKAQSSSSRNHAAFIREYSLKTGKKVYVVAEGGPANVVTLSGSTEPTLIHLTTEILCMNYLLSCEAQGIALAPTVQPVPGSVERAAAELALASLNLSHFDIT